MNMIAGISAATVGAIPALARRDDDPTFAVIERHHQTFMRRLETGQAAFHAPDSGPNADLPENVAIHEADRAASAANEEAAFELSNVVPTTMAGVIALIDYVEAFNRGKFRLNDNWYSGAIMWPAAEQFRDDKDADDIDDPTEEVGMTFEVLVNVRRALAQMQAV